MNMNLDAHATPAERAEADRLAGHHPQGDLIMDVTFYAHHCSNRNNFRVTFSTEEQALAYLARKTQVILSEDPEHPMPDSWARLNATLYPVCEHGLSEALCAGPEHYPTDAQLLHGGY